MPQITSVITGAKLFGDGSLTPAQRFYQQYASAITTKNLSDEAIQFYAKDAVFHNQNGVDYSGTQIWPWIVKLFGQFGKISHDILKLTEIHNDDGTIELVSQAVRHIWVKGDNNDKPTISIPLSMVCVISCTDEPQTEGGMQFKEVWLYWDTYKLLQHLSPDLVVFSLRNIFTQE
ncbi:hypothetical protein PWT90_09068 [Aphanocladium album]|nr:hypothetical protein PWT90_09068 [Aphanocladium album]